MAGTNRKSAEEIKIPIKIVSAKNRRIARKYSGAKKAKPVNFTIKNIDRGNYATGMRGRIKYRSIKFRKGLFVQTIKAIGSLALITMLVLSRLTGAAGFEAHVVNVTATICDFSETRSMGYWKTHQEGYMYYLPLVLGGEEIDTVEKADGILTDASAKDMSDMLKAQLLAMKFNVASFGVGGYLDPDSGKNINDIIAMADGLLSDPDSTREEMENIKDILDRLNNLHDLRYCADPVTPPDKHLVINKVYYDVDSTHGTEPNNEWVELYNPTDSPMDISGFTIADNYAADTIASGYYIPEKGFAVITANISTWNYWDIPQDAAKIVLEDGAIGNGLANDKDMLVLKDASGNIIDQMNWGKPDSSWPNWNSGLWDPGAVDAAEGHALGRKPNGFDTDRATDFKDFGMPSVAVIIPNGGETWWIGRTYTLEWTATNPNGKDSDLKIDIYYSNDSGVTWAPIVKGTENDGAYHWRAPLLLEGGYKVQSEKARIKVVATGPENFMIQAWDPSDRDFCPPIDYSLLTEEEKALLEQMENDGVINESMVIYNEDAGNGENEAAPEDAPTDYPNPSDEIVNNGGIDDNNNASSYTDLDGAGLMDPVFGAPANDENKNSPPSADNEMSGSVSNNNESPAYDPAGASNPESQETIAPQENAAVSDSVEQPQEQAPAEEPQTGITDESQTGPEEPKKESDAIITEEPVANESILTDEQNSAAIGDNAAENPPSSETNNASLPETQMESATVPNDQPLPEAPPAIDSGTGAN